MSINQTLAALARTSPYIAPARIQSIAASVAANALTCTLNPTVLDFRSATLTSGTINSRIVSTAISLVVPSTATLGTVSTIKSRLVVLAIDNAGTVELAIANLNGGLNFNETTVISTTALSAASTAPNVVYSTTARTNVPFRVVGFVESTQTTAGTWVTAPSTIQGAGGEAVSGISDIGYGQTWQVLTGSRAISTVYYNTTGKPIVVSVSISATAAGNFLLRVDGQGAWTSYITTGQLTAGSALVPPGSTYDLIPSGSTFTISQWYELR